MLVPMPGFRILLAFILAPAVFPLARNERRLEAVRRSFGFRQQVSASVRPHMEVLQPGHYWKTPFVWEPGCPEPGPESARAFEATPEHWLLDAVASVMADSLDESDRYAVSQLGPARAAAGLLAIASHHFAAPVGWWRLARDD